MSEILEDAADIKRIRDFEANKESGWDVKVERFWSDKYNAYLKEHNLTDLDVSKFMYPASYN